jgi:ABC-2 type transport system permease protein
MLTGSKVPRAMAPGYSELRASWLVLRREYLQRVLSTSFVITTLAAPVLLLAIVATPALFVNSGAMRLRHIVVVCSNGDVASRIDAALQRSRPPGFQTETAVNATPGERATLVRMVRQSRIDAFLWLDDAAVASGRIKCVSREALDPFLLQELRRIIGPALVSSRLAARGLPADAISDTLRPMQLDSIALMSPASDRAGDTTTALIVTVLIVTGLEMTLLSYGIIVMRSVLEDKTSRVVEILLCSVTSRALMAGKILGIGGVSLTQVLIWAALAAIGMTAGTQMLGGFRGSIASGGLVIFAVLYLLGYLLYSSMYAAVGAAFNSLDDAQYWNFILTLPLLFSGIAAWSLFEQPASPAAIVLSLTPPFAPVMMSMRVAVGSAPAWQVALCLALMIMAIYGALTLSARVYRAGILMYGKKPTLREVVRWLRYT